MSQLFSNFRLPVTTVYQLWPIYRIIWYIIIIVIKKRKKIAKHQCSMDDYNNSE